MRRSTLRLYGPFLALALVQALFIVASPSKAPGRTALAAGPGSRAGGGAAAHSTRATGGATRAAPARPPRAPTPRAPRPRPPRTTGGATGAAATGPPGAAPPGAPGSTPGAAAGGGGGGEGGAVSNVGGGQLAAGDTSHCAGPYQFDLYVTHGPPCQPVFAGDNGGATAPGVTADAIKVIYFESAPNEQVNAILKLKGLATTSEEEDAAIKSYVDFINTHYELYGRKIDLEKVIGDCPTTPPDYAKCEVAANEVVKKQPFAVIWATSLYADVFDIWANAGIISIGGSAFDYSYFIDGG